MTPPRERDAPTIPAKIIRGRRTENKISSARQAYNDDVAEYNIGREQFPNTIIAGSFNFQKAELLEAIESSEERKAPKVSFTWLFIILSVE